MEVQQLLRRARDGQADLVDYTQLVSAYGKAQKWSLSLHALVALQAEHHLTSDTYTFNVAAAACGRSPGQWRWALQVFDGLEGRRLHVDSVSCGVMMSALQRGAQPSSASIDLLTKFQKQSVQLGVQSYNIAISACADEARWSQALDLSSRAPERGLALDDFAKTKLMTMEGMPWRLGLTLVKDGGSEAFRSALQMVGSANQWTLAMSSYQQLCSSRVAPASLGHLAALGSWRMSLEELKGAAMTSSSRDALALLSAALRLSAPCSALLPPLRRLQLGVKAYGAVLGRCAAEKNWTLALALTEMMLLDHVEPDCLCLSSMMDATTTTGWFKALAIFDRFHQESWAANFEEKDLLGSVTIQNGSPGWSHSVQLLRSLRHQSLRPQLLSHTALVLWGDDWRHALQVLQHAQDQLVSPNNSLLSSVAATPRVGTWHVTNELLRMAFTTQVQICTSCFNACMGVSAAASWPQALQQLQTMTLHFLQPDRLTYRSLHRGSWLMALLAVTSPMDRGRTDVAASNGAAQAALLAQRWPESLEVLADVARFAVEFDTVSNYLLMQAQIRSNDSPGLGIWQLSMSMLANAGGDLRDLYRAGIALSLS